MVSPKKLIAIMILCTNTKAMVRSPDGNPEFFGVVTGVLQGDTSHMFMICFDYVWQTSIDLMKENRFTLKKKARSRRLSCRNHDRHRLRRWCSTFREYTCPKPNPYCIAWSKQQEALASTRTQCVLDKKEPSPLQGASLWN